MLRNLNYGNRGIKINGDYFNNLRYADNVVAENTEKLKTTVEELNREGRKAGLEINYQKTKKWRQSNIQVESETIEEVEVVYLEQLTCFHRRREKEVIEGIRKR